VPVEPGKARVAAAERVSPQPGGDSPSK